MRSVFRRARLCSHAARSAPRRVVRQDLAHQKHLVPPPRDRLGDQLLGAAVAIHFGGIDEREAAVETEPERGDFLGALRAVVAHVPGTLAESRDALAAGQGDGFHALAREKVTQGESNLRRLVSDRPLAGKTGKLSKFPGYPVAGYVRKRTEKPAGEAEDRDARFPNCEGEWTCGTY